MYGPFCTISTSGTPFNIYIIFAEQKKKKLSHLAFANDLLIFANTLVFLSFIKGGPKALSIHLVQGKSKTLFHESQPIIFCRSCHLGQIYDPGLAILCNAIY